MKEPKFKAGDWVKDKNGTQGMTVVENVSGNDGSGFSGKVKVKYKDAENQEVEREFLEEDLVAL